MPFQYTTEPESKLWPFTAKVNAGPFATALAGFKLAMAGTALRTLMLTLALALATWTESSGTKTAESVCPFPAGSTVPAGGL